MARNGRVHTQWVLELRGAGHREQELDFVAAQHEMLPLGWEVK